MIFRISRKYGILSSSRSFSGSCTSFLKSIEVYLFIVFEKNERLSTWRSLFSKQHFFGVYIYICWVVPLPCNSGNEGL